MSILKQYTNHQGITLGFHRAVQITVRPSGAKVLVHSWPAKEQFDAVRDVDMPMPRGITEVDLPMDVLTELNPIDAVEQWLVTAPASPFVSGDIDVDASELDQAKANKRRQLLIQRDSLEFAGVNVPDVGLVPTDAASQRLLTGAVVLAMIALSQGMPYSMPFAMKDGTVFTFDATSIVSTSVAIGVYVSAVYVAHRAAVAAIDAATTIEEVNAVQISFS